MAPVPLLQLFQRAGVSAPIMQPRSGVPEHYDCDTFHFSQMLQLGVS